MQHSAATSCSMDNTAACTQFTLLTYCSEHGCTWIKNFNHNYLSILKWKERISRTRFFQQLDVLSGTCQRCSTEVNIEH